MIDRDEQEAIEQLQAMNSAELQLVPFKVVNWQCKIKLCKRCSRMRDYGIHPMYYCRKKWINVYETYCLCSIHNKAFGKRKFEDIPWKRRNGGVINGCDNTGKIEIIY